METAAACIILLCSLITVSTAGYTVYMVDARDVLLLVPDGGALFEPAGIADILKSGKSVRAAGYYAV